MMDSPTGAKRSDSAKGQLHSAITHLPSHARFWVSAVLVLILDLWSKQWAFTSLEPNEVRAWITGVIDLRRSLNDGAVFGSFTGQTSLFIIASLFALLFVLYLFIHSLRGHYVTHVALGLVVAGALGNLYDRATVKADVVRFTASGGRTATVIGVITAQDEHSIDMGDWPDGTNVHTIHRPGAEIRRQGVVRDFIKFVPKLPTWVPRIGGRDAWPWVFNVADASLVCGVILLFVSSWFERRPRD